MTDIVSREMMKRFEGKCVGGPYDGQMMAHTSDIKRFYRPMATFSMNENAPVKTILIGEYRLNNFSQWHWWPTDKGNALDVLSSRRRN